MVELLVVQPRMFQRRILSIMYFNITGQQITLMGTTRYALFGSGHIFLDLIHGFWRLSFAPVGFRESLDVTPGPLGKGHLPIYDVVLEFSTSLRLTWLAAQKW